MAIVVIFCDVCGKGLNLIDEVETYSCQECKQIICGECNHILDGRSMCNDCYKKMTKQFSGQISDLWSAGPFIEPVHVYCWVQKGIIVPGMRIFIQPNPVEHKSPSVYGTVAFITKYNDSTRLSYADSHFDLIDITLEGKGRPFGIYKNGKITYTESWRT